MTINYFDIFDRFHSKVEAYELFQLSQSDVYMKERDWLHTALSYPDVHSLFISLEADDMIAEIECELEYNVNESMDREFIIEFLAVGMVYSWLSQKLQSQLNVVQMYGGKEEKFYSQSAHISELRHMKKDAKKEMSMLVNNRGFYHNTYLDGEE